MGKKILIVDDSALMRRVYSDIIKTRSEYDAPDIAKDGAEGYEKIKSYPGGYDAILLDINMPKLSGLEVLKKLQDENFQHTTIVVSTVAKEGAKETIQALEYGALDFLNKPVNYGEVSGADFKRHLLELLDVAMNQYNKSSNVVEARRSFTVRPKPSTTTSSAATSTADLEAQKKKDRDAIRARFLEAVAQTEARSQGEGNAQSSVSTSSMRPITSSSSGRACGKKLVALACSTGGPKSLQSVIPKLPANLDAPMVLVQHMPKGFTASLAQRLDEISMVKVSEAVDGECLEKGHVYIAPGGMHMQIVKSGGGIYKIHLNDDPPVDALKPCANVMYDSLIDSDFDEITCVVLTGMGADGTKGIGHLSQRRKVYCIGQDAASCVVYGMPKAIADAGLVNEVASLESVADAITKHVGVS